MAGDSVPGRSSSSDGHQDVRGHDAGDAGGDRRSERHELDRLQPIGRMLDQRHLVMRVGAGVAVPGKVLAAGGDALALQRLDDRRPEPRDVFRRARPAPDRRSPDSSGLVRMSSTGVKSSVTPTARSSAASALANRAASFSSPLRPSVCIGGHSVNGDRSRATRPPS